MFHLSHLNMRTDSFVHILLSIIISSSVIVFANDQDRGENDELLSVAVLDVETSKLKAQTDRIAKNHRKPGKLNRYERFRIALNWIADVIKNEHVESIKSIEVWDNEYHDLVKFLEERDPENYHIYEENIIEIKLKEKEEYEREMSEISRKILLLPPNQPLDINETVLKLLESEFQTKEIEEMLDSVNHIIDGIKFRHLIG
ncbi:hypothetical protein JTB14_000378 [Gonioctena quinquepunctata]|nr:hypothetical protein JTB14_000378 [Gonioctena quinquepunctata]